MSTHRFVEDKTPLKDGQSISLAMARRYLNKLVTIVIDQPFGSSYKGVVFEQNYGSVPGTLAPDGDELDAYYLSARAQHQEPLETVTGRCIAIVHRLEDDDDKLVIVRDGVELSNREIERAVHFREKLFKHRIVRT